MAKCHKCGLCCNVLSFHAAGVSGIEKYLDYYTKHGCVVQNDMIHVPVRCPQLGEDNLCKLHDTDQKPDLCKEFTGSAVGKDGSTFIVMPGCGFAEDTEAEKGK